MLGSSGGERENAFTALERIMQNNGVTWTDIGDVIANGGGDAGKYTETELQEYGQALRAEGVEAGIRMGEARASNGNNGHGYTLPKDTIMAEYCHRAARPVEERHRTRFCQPRVPKNTTKSKSVAGRTEVFDERLRQKRREDLTDGDGAGNSTSVGRSRLYTDPVRRKNSGIRAVAKDRERLAHHA